MARPPLPTTRAPRLVYVRLRADELDALGAAARTQRRHPSDLAAVFVAEALERMQPTPAEVAGDPQGEAVAH